MRFTTEGFADSAKSVMTVCISSSNRRPGESPDLGMAVSAAANEWILSMATNRRLMKTCSKEIIFYLITYYTSQSQAGCLGRIGGICKLWLNTPIVVHFSRTDLNMDENLNTANPAATVDIGCGYPSTCTVDGGTYTGWLDSATLTRLAAADGGYGSLVMPHEVVSVPRSTTNRMPHVIVGAPSTDPFRWILGFEDLSGGGDRDFNDVVFQIHTSNGGTVTSAGLPDGIGTRVQEGLGL